MKIRASSRITSIGAAIVLTVGLAWAVVLQRPISNAAPPAEAAVTAPEAPEANHRAGEDTGEVEPPADTASKNGASDTSEVNDQSLEAAMLAGASAVANAASKNTPAVPAQPAQAPRGNAKLKLRPMARVNRVASYVSKAPSFDTFRILLDRNIFSSKRVGKSTEAAAAKQLAAKPPSDVLRLMGTYLTPERTLALFEGTADVPGGGVNVGDSIAGYHLEQVRVDGVVLANAQGKIEIRVGAGLTKNDAGAWSVVDSPIIDRPPDTASRAADSASTSTTANPNDPVEKMRARRKKELGQ